VVAVRNTAGETPAPQLDMSPIRLPDSRVRPPVDAIRGPPNFCCRPKIPQFTPAVA
jgi:hypothetical protein